MFMLVSQFCTIIWLTALTKWYGVFTVKTEPTANLVTSLILMLCHSHSLILKPKNFPVKIFELIFVLYCKNMYKFQFLENKLYVKFLFIGTLNCCKDFRYLLILGPIQINLCYFPSIIKKVSNNQGRRSNGGSGNS